MESLRIGDSTQLCRVWCARKDGEGVRRPDSAPASQARVDYRLEDGAGGAAIVVRAIVVERSHRGCQVHHEKSHAHGVTMWTG